mmetsp:Transcript_4335/g.11355  ORF Transcript_4335/g.11355 Transcript_4335/m.11355 type:complete len:298 (+) Transcript_4335:1145-2038(+)
MGARAGQVCRWWCWAHAGDRGVWHIERGLPMQRAAVPSRQAQRGAGWPRDLRQQRGVGRGRSWQHEQPARRDVLRRGASEGAAVGGERQRVPRGLPRGGPACSAGAVLQAIPGSHGPARVGPERSRAVWEVGGGRHVAFCARGPGERGGLHRGGAGQGAHPGRIERCAADRRGGGRGVGRLEGLRGRVLRRQIFRDIVGGAGGPDYGLRGWSRVQSQSRERAMNHFSEQGGAVTQHARVSCTVMCDDFHCKASLEIQCMLSGSQCRSALEGRALLDVLHPASASRLKEGKSRPGHAR